MTHKVLGIVRIEIPMQPYTMQKTRIQIRGYPQEVIVRGATCRSIDNDNRSLICFNTLSRVRGLAKTESFDVLAFAKEEETEVDLRSRFSMLCSAALPAHLP